MAVTNARVKFIRELQQAKARRKYGAFVVEGLVNVAELLASAAKVEFVVGTEQGLGALRQNLPHGLPLAPEQVESASPSTFERLSRQKSPTGVLAVAKTYDYTLGEVARGQRILYLDGVNDPGNAGTLLRSAEWFGIDAVCASPTSVDWYNPKTVTAARGSLFRLPHLKVDLADLLGVCTRHTLVVADLAGTPFKQFAWPERGVLLLGSESHGPGEAAREALRQNANGAQCVTIEGSGRATESLNVGVAGSVLMAAWGRGE